MENKVYAVQYWDGTFKLYKTKALAKKTLTDYKYDKKDDDYYPYETYEKDRETGEYFARITKRLVINKQ